MKTIVQESFVALGLKKKLLDKNVEVPDLHVYEAGFEKEFLKQTKEFYRKESSEFIAQNTVVEYLKKVEKRFDEEQKRVKNYMDESTAAKVENVLGMFLWDQAVYVLTWYSVDVLIKDHITRLYDEFKTLLEQDKIEDMSRLYCLVKKTLQIMRKSIINPLLHISFA